MTLIEAIHESEDRYPIYLRATKMRFATFSNDLYDNLARGSPEVSVAAISSSTPSLTYPHEVRFRISRENPISYIQAAAHFEDSGTNVVSLQHEYGIFGGPCGSYILHFLRRITCPVVTTLHTVLANPSATQRGVLSEIIRLSARVVVFTGASAALLRDQCPPADRRLTIVPHGSPDIPYSEPSDLKDALDLPGKQVLLTMGFLSPDKGIETVIRALPTISASFPNVAYVVQGVTHPSIKDRHGEAYRSHLQTLAERLGVASRVIFVNRYLDKDDLIRTVADADIYISPHKNLDQAGSGTLACALGLGRPILSTRYTYAVEVLVGGSGTFFDVGDDGDLAKQTIPLLAGREFRLSCGQAAYAVGRGMIWSRVASEYLSLFESALSSSVSNRSRLANAEMLPLFQLHHLLRLTDETGILQHAVHTIPDRREGYCTDDNSRALMLAVDIQRFNPQSRLRLEERYMAFLWHAYNRASGRMRNFFAYNRNWLEDVGSEECHGRTMWCLGHVIAHSRDDELRATAEQLFVEIVPASLLFESLRATAFAIMGLVDFTSRYPERTEFASHAAFMADKLRDRYYANYSQGWRWFEDQVTYFNARIPEALLRFGNAASRRDLIDVGLSALDWLIEIQTAGAEFFDPIGNAGFYRQGEARARFDQQPIEAHSTIDACLAAWEVTGEKRWKELAGWVFKWFTGLNAIGLPVYDPISGGCRDGLGEDGLNYNQGAESTLAFLQALVSIQRHCLQPEGYLQRIEDEV